MIYDFDDDARFYGLTSAESRHFAQRLCLHHGRTLIKFDLAEQRRQRRSKIFWWTLATMSVVYLVIAKLS